MKLFNSNKLPPKNARGARYEKERYKFFRLACFNVFFFNRDDHAKNFGFLMDKKGQWTLSPAYDLTFCKGPGGEHSTTICGEVKNPTIEHLKQLSKAADLNAGHANMIIEQVQESMQTLAKTLKELEVSTQHDVFKYLKLSAINGGDGLCSHYKRNRIQ